MPVAGTHLGRKIFASGEAGFYQETFCLSDGREFSFFHIVRHGVVYHLTHEVGMTLEEIMREQPDQESVEGVLLGYLYVLKKELVH